MPSQSPFVEGTENFTNVACPGTPPAPHPGQGAAYSGAQGSTTPSNLSTLPNNHTFSGHTDSMKSIQTAPQPGQLQGSQTISDTHHQCLGPQPKPRAPEDGGEDAEAAQGKKHYCGICGHLLLAVVLAVFSPLLAVGVCMADMLTGECCHEHGKDMDSVDDP